MKLIFAMLLGSVIAAWAQPVPPPTPELLWPQGAPGALGTEEVDKPALTMYPANPAKAVPTAIIVCPGGGYQNLAMDHEGKQVAEWLNNLGITAFVLKYRLGPRYHHPAPLEDAQQAMRMARAKAPGMKIGIMGFSAGGHLASSVGTHFGSDLAVRPDFMVLGYPVISFTEHAHAGSKRNLLGENPDPKLVELMSNEKQVTAQTPTTFLFHTDNDATVPVENSVMFYMALKRAKVPAE